MRLYTYIQADISSQDNGLFLYSESYIQVVLICSNELKFLSEYFRNARLQKRFTF